MSRSVWRIAAETLHYPAIDLSGEGARITGGRWNTAGRAMIYTSESRALACLETLVHFKASSLPLNRYLVRIDIPDTVWSASTRLEAATSPVGWDAEPAGLASVTAGITWLNGGSSCLLLVPSVIVSEERNVLINPAHPDCKTLTATSVRRWLYDPRFAL